jgi:glycosyltransferase involved in cell wall biosynthesis
LRILHLHADFAADGFGRTPRAARLINAFGRAAAHAIVPARPDAPGAAAAIDPHITVASQRDFPELSGRPLPGRLQRLAAAMKGFDLVLTYNRGAMDAVMAHTLFRDFHGLPPLVHHEDSCNEGRRRSRDWYRRIALGRTSALVVPSRRLEAIALTEWFQPRERVVRIADGIDTAACARKARPDMLPRVIKRPGELWLGTIADLQAGGNLPRLVRAFAGLPAPWQLVILGEGPERDAVRAEALRCGAAHRVHLPGFVAEPVRAIGLFDLFALAPDGGQFPPPVAEAMAAGLAVAAPDSGDIAAMLAEENRPYAVPPGDEGALASALASLAGDEALRRGIGEANRRVARAEYDEKTMIAAYRAVYAKALRRPRFP